MDAILKLFFLFVRQKISYVDDEYRAAKDEIIKNIGQDTDSRIISSLNMVRDDLRSGLVECVTISDLSLPLVFIFFFIPFEDKSYETNVQLSNFRDANLLLGV